MKFCVASLRPHNQPISKRRMSRQSLEIFINHCKRKSYKGFRVLKNGNMEIHTPRFVRGFDPAFEKLYKDYEEYQGRKYTRYSDCIYKLRNAIKKSKVYEVISFINHKLVFRETEIDSLENSEHVTSRNSEEPEQSTSILNFRSSNSSDVLVKETEQSFDGDHLYAFAPDALMPENLQVKETEQSFAGDHLYASAPDVLMPENSQVKETEQSFAGDHLYASAPDALMPENSQAANEMTEMSNLDQIVPFTDSILPGCLQEGAIVFPELLQEENLASKMPSCESNVNLSTVPSSTMPSSSASFGDVQMNGIEVIEITKEAFLVLIRH